MGLCAQPFEVRLDQVRWDPPNNLKGPYNHIPEVSGLYIHFWPRYKGRGNKVPTGERVESIERVEDMDYSTHLDKISSVGQGLCNYSVSSDLFCNSFSQIQEQL